MLHPNIVSSAAPPTRQIALALKTIFGCNITFSPIHKHSPKGSHYHPEWPSNLRLATLLPDSVGLWQINDERQQP
jgi:hypothetical protein